METVAGHDAYEAMSEYAIAAMQYVYTRGRISTKELASLVGKGSTLRSKTLKGLVSKGILAWHGTSSNDPSRFYSLPK